jgi:parvulin-like peptidyl-prolyl isomerase
MRFAVTFGALLLAAIALGACGASHGHGIPANAVAAVEGQGITEEQVRHRMAVVLLSASAGTIFEQGAVAPDPPTFEKCIAHLEEVSHRASEGRAHTTKATLLKECQHQFEALKKQALSQELIRGWELAEAKARGISVSEEEVNKKYEEEKGKRFPTQAKLEHVLASTGQTVADLKDKIKLELLNEKIQQAFEKGKVDITPAEIERYYHTHQSEFGPATLLDVRLVQTATKAAGEAARREIESGKSFAAANKKHSTNDSLIAKGGLFKDLGREVAPPPLENAVFAAKPGVIGGPIKTFTGYYVYEVVDSKHHGAETVSQATPKIKQVLTDEKASAVAQAFANEFKKRWTKLTECRPGSVVEQCKESAATGTGTTSTSTTG